DYPMPPHDLLNYIPASTADSEAAEAEMYDVQQRIIDTLAGFNIKVQAGDITRGPSITRYEFYPPSGLRVNKISNLQQDLMLATSSASINILAPIPGKNTVGIEIANVHKTNVYLRELLEDDSFQHGKHRIPVALGKNVYGQTVIGDLAAMPHTLVAGTTGSGKSVCINSMIISMLYKFSPKDLKLVLVDPKVVEMQPYRKLPHLACPVITDPGRVIGALRWAVNEMEHRYKLFSKMGVRNFVDFNNRPEGYVPEEDEEENDAFFNNKAPVDYSKIEAMASEIERQAEDDFDMDEEDQAELDFSQEDYVPDKLPYIVIIIDELADLMMIVKDDVENYIARLTQKARAAGIHLVVATQTPRSNVVTGIIKANIPSRIAFKVSSPLDSRIILDTDGAENLLGQGDFLFIPPGGISKMTRAQGAFVSDEEVSAVVRHCARHAKQEFMQSATTELEQSDGGEATATNGGRLGDKSMSAEESELYTRCLDLVVTERKASTSLLQRRFSIGYGRAARMMDLLEERGIISPPQGNNSAREILVEQ
ncbi:MAG: DNA translocase FtsK, partial [Akkermansia sp.]